MCTKGLFGDYVVTIYGYRCLRCNRTWTSKTYTTKEDLILHKPKNCAKCHSPNWDKLPSSTNSI